MSSRRKSYATRSAAKRRARAKQSKPSPELCPSCLASTLRGRDPLDEARLWIVRNAANPTAWLPYESVKALAGCDKDGPLTRTHFDFALKRLAIAGALEVQADGIKLLIRRADPAAAPCTCGSRGEVQA